MNKIRPQIPRRTRYRQSMITAPPSPSKIKTPFEEGSDPALILFNLASRKGFEPPSTFEIEATLKGPEKEQLKIGGPFSRRFFDLKLHFYLLDPERKENDVHEVCMVYGLHQLSYFVVGVDGASVSLPRVNSGRDISYGRLEPMKRQWNEGEAVSEECLKFDKPHLLPGVSVQRNFASFYASQDRLMDFHDKIVGARERLAELVDTYWTLSPHEKPGMKAEINHVFTTATTAREDFMAYICKKVPRVHREATQIVDRTMIPKVDRNLSIFALDIFST